MTSTMPFSNYQDTFDWDSAGYPFSVDALLQAPTANTGADSKPSIQQQQQQQQQQQGFFADQFIDCGFPDFVSSAIDLEQPSVSASIETSPLDSNFSINIPWESESTTSPVSSNFSPLQEPIDSFPAPSWALSPSSLPSPTPSLSDESAVHSDNETSHQQVYSKPSASARLASPVQAAASHRKRGRPSIDQTTADRPAVQKTTRRRLPHNQVERKYREGLNAQMDQLRRAVPTLLPVDSEGNPTCVKTSKAAVLASAIEYIKSVEADRDRLLRQLEILQGVRVTGPRSMAV